MLFDVLLAWGGYRLVRRLSVPGSYCPCTAFCILLLLPTVVLNGAYWAQCDSIYGALCLHALASALDRRPAGSVVLLALAFSFKLQTVFLVPLWGALWFAGRVRFRDLLLFPATYVLTIVPALFLGKPLGDILGVYFGQAAEYSDYLTLNAPSLYALIPYGAEVDTTLAARLGILAAFLFTVSILLWLLLRRGRLTDRALFTAGAAFAVGIPLLLPHMHDRYFFLADTIDHAAQEQDDNVRPELTNHIENLEDYDIIFVGFPNWWYDMPMVLYSFFDGYDFSGKTIISFNVHNGSRFSSTIDTIQELESNATVITDGFTVSERNVADAAGDVADWLDGLEF